MLCIFLLLFTDYFKYLVWLLTDYSKYLVFPLCIMCIFSEMIWYSLNNWYLSDFLNHFYSIFQSNDGNNQQECATDNINPTEIWFFNKQKSWHGQTQTELADFLDNRSFDFVFIFWSNQSLFEIEIHAILNGRGGIQF